jgi:small subunit ribosomal protein S4e|tara:strand:+ start:7338 stop:7985 length:648 start_codon:yes stop_codon:yes gene_type:complete
MHLKRQKVPKNWPIPRKGSVYVVRPRFNLKKGLPILIILRDILKVAQNKREVKKTLHKKQILLNNKPVRDERNHAVLFDVIKILPFKKNYSIGLSKNGKFSVDEIPEKEANRKVAKIINKKTLKNKKTQLNLSDGRNFITGIKCDTNGSLLIDLKNKKVEKYLPLKEKSNIVVFEGKHAGKKGIINKVDQNKKIAEINVDKESINVLIKQLIVVE